VDIREITQAMHEFVEAKGWYAPDSLRPQTPRNIATSLALEAAEVLEHFQWADTSREPQELPGELADVALYLLQLSSILGIDLEQAIFDKLDKNYGRTWDAGQAQDEKR
jgi:NTP pyrophosphatase (non-canonical NTP hydrolase)